MKHLLLGALCLPLCACSATMSNSTIYGGASTRHLNFQHVEADIQGGALGVRTFGEGNESMFSELSWGRDEDDSVWLLESKTGADYRVPIADRLYFGFGLHATYAVARVDEFRNKNYLYGGGGSMSLQYQLGNNLVLFARVGASYLWDRTNTATCNDGSTTDDGCLQHGGLNFINDEFGRGSILESTIGIRFGL